MHYTFADVLRTILVDDGNGVPEYHIVKRTGSFLAFYYVYGEQYKGWASCCEKCAINSCAKMVYLDLQERSLLQKVTKAGETIPIPREDYLCLTEYDNNENLLEPMDADDGIFDT